MQRFRLDLRKAHDAASDASLQFAIAAPATPGPQGITGTSGDDTLIGTDAGETLEGLDGNDRLEARGGNDLLYGGNGVDILIGEGGNDTYYLDVDIDEVREISNGGTDTVYTAFTYILPAAVSVELVYMLNATGTAPLTLTGNELGQTLQANYGNNIIVGGAGADLMYGLFGDDIYYVDNFNDIAREVAGQGFDTVFTSVNYQVRTGNEIEVVRTTDDTGTTNIQIVGSEFSNTLYGNWGDNALNGGGGADFMFGFKGADVYTVDNVGDQIFEQADEGEDTVIASIDYVLPEHFENLSGGNLSGGGIPGLRLIGNAAINTIIGRNASDYIDGKEGSDVLTGDANLSNGIDVFAFTAALGPNNIDRITDFEVGEDRIELRGGTGAPFAAIVAGTLAAEAFVVGTQATSSQHRIIYNPTSGLLSYDFDGVGGNAAVAFATITANLQMSASLFTVTSDQVNTTDDTLTGTDGVDDFLFGYGGNDILDGLTGNDTTDGGAGNDTHYVENPNDVVVERAGEGADRVYASASYVLAANAEVEILSTTSDAGTGAIDLTGSNTANAIYGNAGNNILDGGNGDDRLIGFGGTNSLIGGVGLDTADYSAAGGGVVADLLGGGASANGSGGADTFSSIENLIGSANSDTLAGDGLANVLDGRGGSDTLIGRGGDDWYWVDSPGDIVIEGTGGGAGDRIFATGDYSLLAGQEVEYLSTDNEAGTANVALGGNELENIIIGNDGNNILYGKAGFDHIYGNGGDDTYYVSDAGDLIVELQNDGNDRIYASVDYTLYDGGYVEILSTEFIAGTDNISLGGNNLDNVIIGNNGSNTLYGKDGRDTLYGHGGADTFLFTHAVTPNNVDTIGDFLSGTDRIGLYQSVFTAIGSGTLSASAFVLGSAAADGDDRIIYNQASGQLFYDADGSGAIAALQFATVTPGQTLVASDLFVL